MFGEQRARNGAAGYSDPAVTEGSVSPSPRQSAAGFISTVRGVYTAAW